MGSAFPVLFSMPCAAKYRHLGGKRWEVYSRNANSECDGEVEETHEKSGSRAEVSGKSGTHRIGQNQVEAIDLCGVF